MSVGSRSESHNFQRCVNSLGQDQVKSSLAVPKPLNYRSTTSYGVEIKAPHQRGYARL